MSEKPLVCAHCGDPALFYANGLGDIKKDLRDRYTREGPADDKGTKRVYLLGPTNEPCCRGCWSELVLGAIPPLSRRRVGRGHVNSKVEADNDDPSHDNALRNWEDG